MTYVGTTIKDPSAVLDYCIDWSSWLNAIGDTIATSTWTVTSGLTVDSSTNTTTAATIWVSGGSIGKKYVATCRIVTAGARTDDRSILIEVRNR